MTRRLPPWLGPLIALVVVYAVFAFLSPNMFLRPQIALTMARQTVVVAICALGMTMIIVTGGIDLSTGSLVALVTVIVAKRLHDGSGPVAAVLLALAVATAVGALVGLLVGHFKLLPFIATLGAMSVLRGGAKGLAKETMISCDSRGLEKLLSGDLTSPGLFVALALTLAVAGMLRYTRFGRHVFAVGSNEAAARLVGVNTARVKLIVYALAGLLVGVAGVMEFSTLTVGDPTDAVGLELEVIAAVVIGGASLTGGEGSIAGAVMGALLMTVIKMGATSRGLPNWVQEIATGLIIVAAVALDRRRRARERR